MTEEPCVKVGPVDEDLGRRQTIGGNRSQRNSGRGGLSAFSPSHHTASQFRTDYDGARTVASVAALSSSQTALDQNIGRQNHPPG